MIDPVTPTQALVRCPSVTPAEGGALELLQGLPVTMHAVDDIRALAQVDRHMLDHFRA